MNDISELRKVIDRQKQAEEKRLAVEAELEKFENKRIEEEEKKAEIERKKADAERSQLDRIEKQKAERQRIAQKEQQLREAKETELQLQADREKEERLNAVTEEIRQYKNSIVYSDKLAKDICRRVANGEMLSAICVDVTMPPRDKVIDWLDDENLKEFHKSYDNACKHRLDKFSDELIMIADDSTNDYVSKVNSKTKEEFRALDPEALTRSKIRIDIRLRFLKAFDSDRWGDNPDGNSGTGNNNNVPPNVTINYITAAPSPGDNAKVIDHKPGIQIDQKQLTIEQPKKVANGK